MRRIFAVFAIAWCARAQQDPKVTFQSTQASVQDVVMDIARQAGLAYNWQKSFDQTNPECRQWVNNAHIDAVPFSVAMQQILDPAGLRYEVENGDVVLYRAPASGPKPDTVDRKISYYTSQKSVQYIVIDLAQQVGLGYNWDKSFAQTDPDCRRFVFNVSIKNQTFGKAMAGILSPVGLRYRVENDQVVLYPR